MKREYFISAVSAAILICAAPAAFAQSTNQGNTGINAGSGSEGGTSQGTGAASSPATSSQKSTKGTVTEQTKTYVEQASMSDLFEIQSSRLALKKTKDQHISSFAKMMIRDHGQSTAKLKSTVAHEHLALKLPTTLDAEHEKMLSELKSASGKTFDSDYVKMQQEGHQKALQLHQSYAQSGDDASLKAFADNTSKIVQEHLTNITNLAKSMNIATENP